MGQQRPRPKDGVKVVERAAYYGCRASIRSPRCTQVGPGSTLGGIEWRTATNAETLPDESGRF